MPIRAYWTDEDEVDRREGRPWRLPNTTYPLKYHLHITTGIHREIFNFTGNVTIELLVKENTSEIVLHAKELQIQSVFIQNLATKETIENLNSRSVEELLVIDAGKNSNRSAADADVFLSGHHLRLEIHYSGVINDGEFGFQKDTYFDTKGKTIYGAFTHMEPTGARRVLPCYDEPGLKATFSVRITHGSNYTAISNMPAITTRKNDADDMTTTTFMETPKMCTYLLACVVSNFEYISQQSDGILHRVFRPPNIKDRGALALNNSVNAIRAFSRYMDIPYSLPKLDHVDVNLHSDGMENWGLITYSKSAFVQTTKKKNFYKIMIQSHEIVHQWFGNLVSPTWWDSIWLNEGFATYYSYKLVKMLYPEYDAESKFQDDNCYDFLGPPVIKYVEKPVDILNQILDSSYTKGSCLLNLLNMIIGEETFHRGVKDFVKAHAYSNANSDQFFQHLQTASDSSNKTPWKLNISEVIKPYFTTTKHPELFISCSNSNTNIIHIKQMPQEIAPDGSLKFWWIPLNFAKADETGWNYPYSIRYMMPPISEVTLDLRKFNIKIRRNDALVVYIPGIVDFEANYDDVELLKIARTLQKNPNSINKMNRIVMLHSINKMWPEQSSLVPKFELLKYLRKERDVKVWRTISDDLLKFSKTLYASPKSDNLLKEFMRNIVATHYKKYDNKSPQNLSAHEADMMKVITSLACNLGLDACLSKSREKFLVQKKNIYDGKNKHNDPTEICNAAKTLNNREFSEALSYLKVADVGSQTMNWTYLRCTDREEQYEEFLNALRDIPTEKKERKKHLSLWADLLTSAATDPMKWNSTYNFLMEQMPKLETLSNEANDLCARVASIAEDVRGKFQSQYINLMKLCTRSASFKGVSSPIIPNLKRVGANYQYEKYPLWQRESEAAQKWLEEENKLFKYHNDIYF